MLDRVDVRWILIWGAIICGLALSSVAFADSIALIYLLFTIFGIGNTGVSIVVSTTLVTRWFPGSNRSVALSVASTGLSMGGVLITPASAWLFEKVGVVAAMPGFGVFFAVSIVLITLLLIRDRPTRTGDSNNTSSESVWTYADAARSRFFMLITAGYVFCMASQVGGIAHLYNLVEGRLGFVVAATAVQALTLMSILSRIVGGFVLTRIALRWFALANLAGQSIGLGFIAVADSRVEILVAAGLFGATVGNLLMLHPLWLADAFGVSAYPRLFSVSNAWTVAGVALGPLIIGIIYDLSDYGFGYGLAMLLSLIALALVAMAGAGPEQKGR